MDAEKIRRSVRRWWYNRSKGRIIALFMLFFLIGAAILDTRCPDEAEVLPVAQSTVVVADVSQSTPVVAGVPVIPISDVADIVDSSVQYYRLFNEHGKRLDIPPKIIARWAYHESAMNPKAARYEPHLGEWSRGIGQFLESTWREWAAAYGYSWSDAYDPAKNIRVMADYLSYSRSVVAKPGMTEKQVVELMLAGYNAGPGTAKVKGLNAVNASVRAKIADTAKYAGY